jgi:fumarylpyruvate hydrolase
MTDYAFPPPDQASIGIAGSTQRFPVHRIYCVGRNFAEHAREMGAEPPKGQPVFFMKPADAVIQNPHIPYPGVTNDLHHEVELVVALGPAVPDHWTAANAIQAVFGHAVGLDLTRRDLQAAAKEKRLPWDTSKGFDASAPISDIIPAAKAVIDADTQLSLHVNGALRQKACLGDMIFSVTDVLLALSELYILRPGDLVFMGTPSGVAALQKGDHFHAELHGVTELHGTII